MEIVDDCKFSVMRVGGSDEENTSVVHLQALSKPCRASTKFALSVCTKYLKNC